MNKSYELHEMEFEHQLEQDYYRKESLNASLWESIDADDIVSMKEAVKLGANIDHMVEYMIGINNTEELIYCIKEGASLNNCFESAISLNCPDMMSFLKENYKLNIKPEDTKYINTAIKYNALLSAVWLYEQGVILDKEFAKENGNENIKKWILSLDLDKQLNNSDIKTKRPKV